MLCYCEFLDWAACLLAVVLYVCVFLCCVPLLGAWFGVVPRFGFVFLRFVRLYVCVPFCGVLSCACCALFCLCRSIALRCVLCVLCFCCGVCVVCVVVSVVLCCCLCVVLCFVMLVLLVRALCMCVRV